MIKAVIFALFSAANCSLSELTPTSTIKFSIKADDEHIGDIEIGLFGE